MQLPKKSGNDSIHVRDLLTRLLRQCGAALALALLLGAAGVSSLRAQTPVAPAPKPTGIEGVVVDTAGRPLRGARLVVRDTARIGTAALRRNSSESDSAGVFRISGLPAGAHVLEVQLDEYEPAGFRFDISTGITAKVRITLQKDPLWAEMKRAADSILAEERLDSIARAAAAAAKAPQPQFGKGLLYGRILTPDGKPVGRAQIAAMGTNLATMTDTSGRFRFGELPVGPYFLRARKVGYDPVVFTAQVIRGDSLDATIVLTPFTASRGTRLDTVRVTADADRLNRRLVGYQDRKRTARGLFIDQAEITLRRPQNLSDLLRGRANVTVQRDGATGNTQIFGPRLSIGSGACPLALIVDGTFIANAQGAIDTYVPVTMVAAIEVYNSGTSVPSEFQRIGTDCGAIIVWTK